MEKQWFKLTIAEVRENSDAEGMKKEKHKIIPFQHKNTSSILHKEKLNSWSSSEFWLTLTESQHDEQ